ncbi:DNA repair protein rad2 [Aspergillus nanangensis]|uniref:DNA repair protein rad2 n=1 Tax=Aspergillus nanangensis TaxID=2582783 RepID=A0AAD4CEK1_ASPNN|nr:DNA repair protein rad2 [Aspergillus nanangensis]
MGVHGLWDVVQPCARPIKLETLNKKRLAVDASIWIYQFLKAVRDKEGNALRNSHVVGFFRRICKLLFFGIKPVFVFDGGAPILKRQTIAGRKKRREGRREDAVRTAGKLLAVQLQRSAEEEEARRRARPSQPEEVIPDNPVYAEEIFMSNEEKQQNRRFRKKDAYHLPDLQGSLAEMGAPNDPRIMSREELEEYARQFHQGEDINLYDFSKIDFDGSFFLSLPPTDRYNILNAARLRSRLRMGYSKEQLDIMFPDRMAFSKFQIERVKERNDLTQRLMNLNGMNGEEAFYNSVQRIAGERGKEYVLVKDGAVEGGWVLGVVGNKDEGHEDKPIDVEQYGKKEIFPEIEEPSDGEGSFEDVPIEGLNRLPKLHFLKKGVFDDSIQGQSQTTPGGTNLPLTAQDLEDDSLFVQEDGDERDVDDLFQRYDDSDEEDLQKAIQMSLQADVPKQVDDDMPDIAINRDNAPLSPRPPMSDIAPESDDDEMDFAAALAQTRRTQKDTTDMNTPRPTISHPFSGPLPFETLGSKPINMEKSKGEKTDENAGGFLKKSTKTKELPLPPWFSGTDTNTEFIPNDTEDDSLERYRDITMTSDHVFLRDHRSPDFIDTAKLPKPDEVIDLDTDSEDQKSESAKSPPVVEKSDVPKSPTPLVPAAEHRSEEPDHTESPKLQVIPEAKSEEKIDEGTDADEGAFMEDQVQQPHFEPSPSPQFEDVPMPEPQSDTVFDISGEQTLPIHEIDQAGNLVEDEGFSDPEDEDLMRQLAAEGEEHVRFAATLNPAPQVEHAFDYEQELKQLRSQQKKDRRDADEVSQIMISECQQLLTLFGLPYVTAPMEAEAQCAELVSLGLVDGIITDDSDVFLFGGTRVYKNMFNQGKFVECYLTSDLEKEYALHRKKLISFAHLLGSDYTEGIPGVGPVTALEILTEFSNLEEFRDWWTQVQTGLNAAQSSHAAFYKKFKKQVAKIFLPPAFPDAHVDAAYLEPEVDADPSPFQWGVPDLHGLRNYLMATIGWSQERTDEILVPVIRDMNRREQEGTQSNITSFFQGPQGAGAFAPRVHRGGQSRMEKAFGRLRREAEAGNHQTPQQGDSAVSKEDASESLHTSQRPREKRKGTKRSPRDVQPAQDLDQRGDGDETASKKRKTQRNAKPQ